MRLDEALGGILQCQWQCYRLIMANSSCNDSDTAFHKDRIPVDDRDSHSPLKTVNARAELSVSGHAFHQPVHGEPRRSQPVQV